MRTPTYMILGFMVLGALVLGTLYGSARILPNPLEPIPKEKDSALRTFVQELSEKLKQ